MLKTNAVRLDNSGSCGGNDERHRGCVVTVVVHDGIVAGHSSRDHHFVEVVVVDVLRRQRTEHLAVVVKPRAAAAG